MNADNGDGCKFCLGAKGGVPGNENVIGGEVICDYCTSLLMKIKDAEKANPTSSIFAEQPNAAVSAMRSAFHVNMLRAFPNKTHAEIAAEIDKATAAPAPVSGMPDLTPGSSYMVDLDSVLRHAETFGNGNISTASLREFVLRHQAAIPAPQAPDTPNPTGETK